MSLKVNCCENPCPYTFIPRLPYRAGLARVVSLILANKADRALGAVFVFQRRTLGMKKPISHKLCAISDGAKKTFENTVNIKHCIRTAKISRFLRPARYQKN